MDVNMARISDEFTNINEAKDMNDYKGNVNTNVCKDYKWDAYNVSLTEKDEITAVNKLHFWWNFELCALHKHDYNDLSYLKNTPNLNDRQINANKIRNTIGLQDIVAKCSRATF